MAYFVIIQAEDGQHVHKYMTRQEADMEMQSQVGRELPPISINRSVIDDWGRRIRIEEWPDSVSEQDLRDYSRAYDARECGTLTKKQRELLRRMEG